MLSRFFPLLKGAISEEDKNIIELIRDNFGFTPRRVSLYRQALRHKSIIEKEEVSTTPSNERLEFLGDAILSAVVSHYLFNAYPKKDEGFLTTMRSKFVSRKQLNGLAQKLHIKEFLISNLREQEISNSLAGNALEAIIGAIYLEKGYAASKKIILKQLLGKHLNLELVEKTEHNYKSKLLEWAQKEKHTVTFEVEEEKDEPAGKLYFVRVILNGEGLELGKGMNKKTAEQKAAHKSWRKMFP